MNSAGHKANILKRAYREVGIGIRLGVPEHDGVGATITADFGVTAASLRRARWPTSSRFRALHYDLDRVGGLQPVAAPPYDVIDAAQRAELLGRSPYNVVEIDLPAGRRRPVRPRRGDARRLEAPTASSSATTSPRCGRSRRTTPGRTGAAARATAFFARVQRRGLRPRAHPPARAHASRPEGGPAAAHARHAREPLADLQPLRRPRRRRLGRARAAPQDEPWGEVTDEDGTVHRLWRVADPAAHRGRRGRARRRRAADRRRPPPLRDRARLPRRRASAGHVLMCLVALQDPGLTVFPTHRLLTGLDDAQREALRDTIQRRLRGRARRRRRARADRRRTGADGLPRRPPQAPADAHAARPGDRRRRAAGQARALPRGSTPRCSRRWCCTGALGMSEDDISHLNGLDYARDDDAGA